MNAVRFDDDAPDGADPNGASSGDSALADGKSAEQQEADEIMNAGHFNAVEYINKHFPTEQTLGNLEPFSLRVKAHLFKVDQDLLALVRKQALSAYEAQQDLERAKSSIKELFSKVNAIKTAAQNSEAMVEDLCRDIKSLDYAKRNLTATVTTFRRIHMLTTAVSQLKDAANTKQYVQSAQLLGAVAALLSHFEHYSHHTRIYELQEDVKFVRVKLEKTSFAEFVHVNVDEPETFGPDLMGGCAVIDALGPEVRKKFITWFIEQLLLPYSVSHTSALGNFDDRLKFCRLKLRAFSLSVEKVFPTDWCFPQEFALEFCLETRKQLTDALRANEDSQQFDVSVLLKTLKSAIDFEKELQTKFMRDSQKLDSELDNLKVNPNLDPNSAEAIRQKHILRKKREQLEKERQLALQGESQLHMKEEEKLQKMMSSYKFSGLMSSCFEPYMGSYVEHEENMLSDVLTTALSQEIWKPEADLKIKMLNSAGDVFVCIKKSLERCAAFTRGQILLQLAGAFRRVLDDYAQSLRERLPKPQPVQSTSIKWKELLTVDSDSSSKDRLTEEVRLESSQVLEICYIINTGEYCSKTSTALVESIQKKIDEQYARELDPSHEQNTFAEVINHAVRILVMYVETRCDNAFAEMTRMQWMAMTEIGDVSSHATEVGEVLRDVSTRISEQLTAAYYRFVCDKLAQWFIPKYTANVYKCKRIGDIGSQQLLLDAQYLHTVLSKMCEDNKFYQKYLNKEMGKTEAMLKVVHNPVEIIVSSYKALVPGGSSSDFQRLLELKGLKKSDWQPLLERFEREQQLASAAGGASIPSSGSASSSLGSSGRLSGESGQQQQQQQQQQQGGGGGGGGAGGGGGGAGGGQLQGQGAASQSTGKTKTFDRLRMKKMFGLS